MLEQRDLEESNTKSCVSFWVFSENSQLVGEAEFDELSKQEVLKKEQKALIRRLCFGGNSAVGSLSLAVTLATARAQLDVEQEADALSFLPSALVAVLLVALSIWWSLPVRRTSSLDFDEVNTMSRSPRRRTIESPADQQGVEQQLADEDMKGKNLKKIVMMAAVIVENMKISNYGRFERRGFMKSLCHLRMMIDVNERGHSDFVKQLLETLDNDKEISRSMLNQLAHFTPVVILSFDEEVEYFDRYNHLITEHDRNTLRDTDLDAGFHEEDEEEDQAEGDEDKRRRYLFSSIDEVSDVEFWQSLWHHEEDEGDDSGQEEQQDGVAVRRVPEVMEPESEEAIEMSEQHQRVCAQRAEVDATFSRMEEFAREQEANGDLAGAQRTRDLIDSMVPM